MHINHNLRYISKYTTMEIGTNWKNILSGQKQWHHSRTDSNVTNNSMFSSHTQPSALCNLNWACFRLLYLNLISKSQTKN